MGKSFTLDPSRGRSGYMVTYFEVMDMNSRPTSL